MAGPTRTQKRWSGRFRTAGALLLLLGLVGVADRIIGLASHASNLEPVSRLAVPVWALASLLVAGAIAFGLGKRWSR